MTNRKFVYPALIASSLFITGCASEPGVRVDVPDTDLIVDEGINLQDWNDAAADLTTKMLTSGALERSQNKPAILKLTRVRIDVRDPTLDVNSDLLTDTIKSELLRSGKVEIVTEDGESIDDAKTGGFLTGERNVNPRAGTDFAFNGKIIQLAPTKAGNIRQQVYRFSLELVDSRTGRAIWSDKKDRTKQIRRPSLGY